MSVRPVLETRLLTGLTLYHDLESCAGVGTSSFCRGLWRSN
jgi:hypothetical protein